MIDCGVKVEYLELVKRSSGISQIPITHRAPHKYQHVYF